MTVDLPHVEKRAEQPAAAPAALRLGWVLVRTTAGFGLRLLQRQAPLALNAGPLGRASSTRRNATLRSGGRDLEPNRHDLSRAYPHATGLILVLVPDSARDESCWNVGHAEYGGSYPSRLASLLDWTPVHLRAPLPTADPADAAELSALVQALFENWPVPVERIVLLGAGDGGLALREAAATPTLATRTWQEQVTHVVLLGTPHLLADPAGAGLPVGRGLDEELAGIVTSDRARPDLAPMEHATYTVVTRKARLERNPVGALLGNLVWWRDRSRFRARRAQHLFPTAGVVHVEDARAPLTNHPEVQHALLDWLA